MGGTQCNLGNVVKDRGQFEAALTWYAQAVATLQPVLAQETRNGMARLFLRNSHWGTAEALTRLGRHADALPDWDRAIDLTEGPTPPNMRLQRAIALVHLKQYSRATAEATILASAANANADTLYDAACVYALSGAAAQDDPTHAESCANRAIALLRQAIAKGWKNAEHLKTDRDLDSLRRRDDFQKLVAELEHEAKAEPRK